MVLNSSGANIQTNNYYPFGAVFSQYSGSNSKHLFNGKELQEETDWLDFHARYYMADLGRTTCMDPHAENYYGESSYSFMGNNPIANIDPTGMDYWSTNDPNHIAAFFLALTSGMGNFQSFDYSGWDHATDAGFTGNLTYSDETNTFYSNYGAIRNGEITIVGVSIKGSSLGGKSAGFAGAKGPEWYATNGGGTATVYVETDGIGHTYIEIDGTVFSYGRYNGSFSPSMGGLGPVGEGVLYKVGGQGAIDFINERTSAYPTEVYSINVESVNKTFGFFNGLYLNGGENNIPNTRVINDYYIIGNNCTTIVCDGLRAGGASVPRTVGTPYGFVNWQVRSGLPYVPTHSWGF
jgi:RHS repeat-associated protein